MPTHLSNAQVEWSVKYNGMDVGQVTHTLASFLYPVSETSIFDQLPCSRHGSNC